MTTLKKIEPEADGVLKDGQTIRVRMTMMDAAVQKELAGKFAYVADNHRPHYATLSDAQRAAASERQTAYDKRVSDAWRNPPPMFVQQDLSQTPAEVIKPVAFGEGRPINDASGLDALQAANERRYAAKVSEAWRNPANQGVR